MLFNSPIFLVFLTIVIPLFYFLPQRYKNSFLLISSYIFYGYWDWRFCSLLLLSTLVDFFCGKAIYGNRSKKRIYLALSLLTNLGILGFFKYFGFFADSFQSMINLLGFQLDFVHLHIILPVGISFYTFQTLTYTIDIYREKIKPTTSFIDFAVYVAFFPQLVAGPIERAAHLLPQISAEKKWSAQRFNQGFALISMGMLKKVFIGDTCGRFVDHIFAAPQNYPSIELLSALILFSIQIYADFSGYSSIARGTSKLLGVDLMHNFRQPYLSRNITEFWRRWHISLSSWLRDYLYIPLGGNRKGRRRTLINLMLTMLLGGLWHGANWTFVVWGGLHGIYLAVHKVLLKGKKITGENVELDRRTILPGFIIKVLLTNLLVLFTWLFFRAQSFDQAFYIMNQILHWSSSGYSRVFIQVVLTYSLVILVIDILDYISEKDTFLLNMSKAMRVGFYTALWPLIFMYLFQAKPMPFIYFQF